MPVFVNPQVVLAFRVLGWAGCVVAIALGGGVLLGWVAGVPGLVTVRPGLAAMSPMTAFGFILAGVSLAARKRPDLLAAPAVARGAAFGLMGLAAVMLAGHAVAGHDILNPLVGNRLPGGVAGKMGPATAFALILVAASLLALGRPGRVGERIVIGCAATGLLITGVALLGYAYGVEGLYAVGFYRSTALHTACGLFILFLSICVHDPERGWAAIVASGRPSGDVTRMQLVLATLLPGFAGLFLLRAVRAGGIAPSLGMAALVVCTIIPIVLRILYDGRELDRLDMQLSRAADAQLALNAELEDRVEARTAELFRAEGALRQAQKMEAVGQLTGGLAHDFNNLLTGVLGSLELLQARLAQGRTQDTDRYINTALGAGRRAAGLTHRLLAFSRRQTLDPRATNVNQLVTGMEELIRRTMGPETTVELVTAGGLWTAMLDGGQVESALLNLAINARDAMPGGGKLVIETANRWLDERAAAERDVPPGQYVSLCISDNGTGMAPEVASRAFDPFFTTKPIGLGTGLGLSMVYGFVRQSGGQVRIYSEAGKGTTICLYLPRHIGEAERLAPVVEPVALPRSLTGETVLVVDDEPSVRMLVADVLEQLGYAPIEAEDGARGLAILRSSTVIDLLISDVGLPGGMNGRQMADAARVLRPALKVLFITGYAENAVLSHGHLEPGMQVLTKPFAMDVLARRIKDMIAAG